MCGCILILEIVAYFFLVILTLNFDLSGIKNMYGAYLLYYMTKNSRYVDTSFGSDVQPAVFGSLVLDCIDS